MQFVILGLVVSIGLGLYLYPLMIENLNSMNVQQQVSEYALDAFKDKQKTPTFGGLLFVALPIIIIVVFRGFSFSTDLALLVFVYGAHGVLGFVDDYKIVKDGKNDGISPRVKLFGQILIAFVFYGVYILSGGTNELVIPLINVSVSSWMVYCPLVIFMIVGTSNGVNLTDGMDGLAGGTVLIALLPFAYFAYIDGRMDILLFISTVVGSLIAFLVFNKKPARIFMGDVGSLALGALLASLAILLNRELLLIIIGFVFVFETLCVIIQQISWRTRKKRVFRYTPIHYSFTLSGWKEQDVVNMFYVMGVIALILGLLVSMFV